jgi:uncharacterized membrane protein HdeD (DUF308 family)
MAGAILGIPSGLAAPAPRHRWSLALRGLLALVIGGVMLAMPAAGLIALVAVVAVLFAVDGVVSIGLGIWNIRSHGWWLSVVQGVVSLAIAVLAFLWPQTTVLVLVWLTAAFAIWQGVSDLMIARLVPDGGGWLVVEGMLSLLLGIVMIAVPLLGAISLVALVAAYAIIRGIALLALALRKPRTVATLQP